MSIEYPDWLQDLHIRGADETAGEHLARIVRALDGISLVRDRELLEQLFYASEETAARARLVSAWKTNCASSAKAIYSLAGMEAEDIEIESPLENGRAVEVLRRCAKRKRAVIAGSQWHLLRPGCGMMYWSTGNDAHFEWCLSDVNGMGQADHGGGGRSDNAITCGYGDVRISWGRPLQEIYLPELMATNPARGDNPY